MTLQDDALRLAELDRQVVQTLMEGKTEEYRRVLSAYRELRVSLKSRIIDEPAVSIEDTGAREVLHKISSVEGLLTDTVLEQLEKLSGDDLAFGEFDDVEIEELGSELFYSWYSHHEYITALAELRPLILRCDTSKSVRRLVGQVKQCYAFQQYDAAIVMCRALLEESAREIGEQRGLRRRKGMYGPKLFKKVSSGPLREKLEDLYERLSKVSHAQREATRGDARKVFQKTLSAIEELYESPRP